MELAALLQELFGAENGITINPEQIPTHDQVIATVGHMQLVAWRIYIIVTPKDTHRIRFHVKGKRGYKPTPSQIKRALSGLTLVARKGEDEPIPLNWSPITGWYEGNLPEGQVTIMPVIP